MPAKKHRDQGVVFPVVFNDPTASAAKKSAGHTHEKPLQVETASYLDAALLKPGAWWCHIPNEAKRSLWLGASLKKQGLKAGALDNFIVWDGRAHFIELKSDKGVLSAAQKKVISELESAGAPVAVARTLEEVAAALTSWGIPLTMTPAEFRSGGKAKLTPTRMSVSEYKAVMGLDAAAKKKKAVSWQEKLTAARQPLAIRVKSGA